MYLYGKEMVDNTNIPNFGDVAFPLFFNTMYCVDYSLKYACLT